MRRKTWWWMVSVVALISVCSLMQGCKLSEDQMKAIANEAGLVSAVTWIAYDNPPEAVRQQVAVVLNEVKDKMGLVEQGKTYVEVLMPVANKIIDEKVEEQYRPLCRVGVNGVLSGIDLLFVLHPEFKAKQDLAIRVSTAFCKGAITGLGMKSNTPEIKAIQPQVNLRSVLNLNKNSK